MNGFTNLEPYNTRVEDVVCKDCGKTFQFYAQYDMNVIPISFRSKYCPECDTKRKITGPNGSWGTITTESAKVPQRNVEGLEESLQTLATSIVNDRDEFGAFKKRAEHDIEQNKLKLEKFLDVQIDVNDKVTERIAAIRHNLNSLGDLQIYFKKYQDKFNEDQIGINRAHFTLIKESHKTLIIGFSVFVFFMLATWGYLIYTAFKH